MSKRLKIKLANKAIWLFNLVSRQRIKGRKEYRAPMQFDSIVVFSTTALGDFMFNTPAIRAIRESFPKARLTLVSSKKNKTLVDDCPYFSRVVYWDQKINNLLSVVLKIRKEKPQLAVLLHSKMPYDVMCAAFSGCEFIIRDNYDPNPMGMEQWLADYSTGFDGHLIERKLLLVSRLGCNTQDCSMFVPTSFTPAEHDPKKIIIGFQMGASEALRCWPVKRFVELAKLLLAKGDKYHIALIGSAKELPIADEFLQAVTLDERSRIMNYVGTTTLPQLLAHIDNFDTLVTGDTGPLHLAVALRKRTVSLFVTANPKSTGPFQDFELHQVISVRLHERYLPVDHDQPLMIITAEEVLDRINIQLDAVSSNDIKNEVMG